MLQEDIILYIRENEIFVSMLVYGVIICILLAILFQIIRTRREVHKICKKVRKYFDVILCDEAEEMPKEEASTENPVLVYQKKEEYKKQKEQNQEEEARLLMDVIQEVF